MRLCVREEAHVCVCGVVRLEGQPSSQPSQPSSSLSGWTASVQEQCAIHPVGQMIEKELKEQGCVWVAAIDPEILYLGRCYRSCGLEEQGWTSKLHFLLVAHRSDADFGIWVAFV